MKIGDEIVCMDNCYAEELVIDEKYLILNINQRGNFQLQSVENSQILPYYYDAGRFEPVNTEETIVNFGGISIKLYNDRSVLFGGSVGTMYCSNEEIDDLIAALTTMRNS